MRRSPTTEEVPVARADYDRVVPAVLDGHPQVPGRRAVRLLQRWLCRARPDGRAGQRRPFHDLVRERVLRPAGMTDTEFLRSDALPGRAAGYLDVDGVGAPTFSTCRCSATATAASTPPRPTSDHSGRRLRRRIVTTRFRPETVPPTASTGGLDLGMASASGSHGSTDTAMKKGSDAGVRSHHARPNSGPTFTVLSNTSDGAWPIARYLGERFADDG